MTAVQPGMHRNHQRKGGCWKSRLDFQRMNVISIRKKYQKNIDVPGPDHHTCINIAELTLSVSRAAERFLQSSSWEEVIEEVLAMLGSATGSHRVYIFENFVSGEGRLFVSRRYEWVADGFQPIIERPKYRSMYLDSPDIQEFVHALSSNKTVWGHLSDLPAIQSNISPVLNVQSILMAPIMVVQKWWGILVFEECQGEHFWSEEVASVLKIAADVLGAAIQKRQSDGLINNLYASEREQRKLAQTLRSVGIRMTGTLDLNKILDIMIEELQAIVPYDTASVIWIEGEAARVIRWRGYDLFGIDFEEKIKGVTFNVDSTLSLMEILRTGKPLIIPDTTAYKGWVWTEVGRHIRSYCGAPLLIKEKIVAVLSLDKIEAGFYGPEHAELITVFCNQAALAIQNASLYQETLEMLAREQGLNQLIHTISTIIDLPKAINETLQLAAGLVDADAGALAILSVIDDLLYIRYQYNLPTHLAELPVSPGDGVAWDVVEHCHPMIVNEYPQNPHAHKPWVDAGLQSMLAVPVQSGAEVFGILGMFIMKPGRAFSERDLALIEAVGRQIGIAIQNVNLYEAVRRRAQEAEVLREASSAVTSALDLDSVIDRILINLEKVVPYDSASLFLLDDDRLHMVAGRGFPTSAPLIGEYFPANNLLVQEIIENGRPMALLDASADDRFEGWGGMNYIHGWIGTVLQVQGKTIGVLTIDSRQIAAYDNSDAMLVQAFANEAAVAIEKARLFNQVQQLAIRDPLTGLYNRRYFFDVGQNEFERAQVNKTPLALIMLDIDHFKKFNDQYGHMTGDRVLLTMARKCQELLREIDVIARYGGEEFLILLPETPLARALIVAERIQSAFKHIKIDVNDMGVGVSVSFGIADNSEECPSFETLFNRADQALYISKNTFRGRISVWSRQ